MKIVIIEDEKFTANDLATTIKTIEANAKIVSILSSVRSAISYFQCNVAPDLIFSDIQLGDGLSFEIFNTLEISSPVIFCTAYDEYALSAFKTNSIDYVLKPFSSDAIENALTKYKSMKQSFSNEEQQYKALVDMLTNRNIPETASVLVHYKDKIKPIRIDDIALFYLDNKLTHLITLDQQYYTINKNLEELELLIGDRFFRVNRQCLISRKTVIDASHYFSRKLSVNITVSFQDKITVSKEKTPQFLDWLEKIR